MVLQFDAGWGATKCDGVRSLFRNIRKKAGLPVRMKINAHALRHRFARLMLDEFDSKSVSQWMGIEVNTLMEVYAY